MEDIFESLKLSPVLTLNDFYQKMSWWDEGDIGENESINSDVPAQSEEGIRSPESSPVKSHRSGKHDGVGEASHAQILDSVVEESLPASNSGEC